MQFETCAHGNIGLTCPQCRGRQPSVPGSGFGMPAAVPKSVPGAEPGINLGEVIGSVVTKLDQNGDRQAAGVKAFWAQINKPTTVAEHEAEHREA